MIGVMVKSSSLDILTGSKSPIFNLLGVRQQCVRLRE